MTALGRTPREVAITGAGVVSPLADSRAALHRALAQGRSAQRPVEAFELGAVPCRRGAELNG
ncbi:MAG TPA: beta-ketoacyl-[acyl-carrier-protein] synthase II, partial [Thermoanaerobaculia bacterium]|nr:beta-ketoacyl-[acyl-carrier-protein] synthase II [Thermoanaerobaculia bacterium]